MQMNCHPYPASPPSREMFWLPAIKPLIVIASPALFGETTDRAVKLDDPGSHLGVFRIKPPQELLFPSMKPLI